MEEGRKLGGTETLPRELGSEVWECLPGVAGKERAGGSEPSGNEGWQGGVWLQLREEQALSAGVLLPSGLTEPFSKMAAYCYPHFADEETEGPRGRVDPWQGSNWHI